MSMTNEINTLKKELEKLRADRYKAEAKMDSLKHQKEDLVSEIKKMGVDPEDLDKEIIKLEKEINDLIEEVKEMIPNELLK
ncbi:hypothetical protein PRVXT_001485 [Proteinivorax tanatarense]|uniref:Uncharacterized protein n=1 Tax=Proteinivorax tanatarense TaxID=1260629 RepID=A0AAU7VQG5_9FIRM